MTLELRPYQRDAVDAINAYFRETGGNPLVEIPTGGGKSLVIGTFIKEALDAYPDTRIACLAHVPELLTQNYMELKEFWWDAPAGIYSAKLGKKDLHRPILFAGIQSIHRKGFNFNPPDIVLIDEAHLIPRKNNTMYRRFLMDMQKANPLIKFVGFSATLFRMDSGMLHQGDDAIFNDICYSINIRTLIDDGYLSPPVSQTAKTQLDTSNVIITGGEFQQKQLEAIAVDPDTVNKIADEILANSEGRNGILVFGCGVQHCEMLQEALEARGISCGTIFGHTPNDERARTLANFKSQRIRALSSMGVLTTGFNAKHVDMIALARATQSRGLYIQIVGRGTRLFPGKENCLCLDFGGNIARHGPIDDVKPLKEFRDKKDKQAAPTKECPRCGHQCPLSSMICEECEYEFPPMQKKIDTEASTLDIMSRKDLSPQWLDVNKVSYGRHQKLGYPDSLRVNYHCGLLTYSEWICPEHEGSIKIRSQNWFKRRALPNVPIPYDVSGAIIMSMQGGLDWPSQIAIRPNGKYWEVIAHREFQRDAKIISV